MTTTVISVQGLGKRFRRNSAERPFKIKHLFTGRFFRKSYESFWCLDDVTFEVPKGEMIGIIGPNGSGKSTLLRLIGGVGRPDKGFLEVNGRIGALLDLGAGFHNDLSGRDNIYISGVVAGLTRRQISKRFDEIVAFADLKSFLDNPLRTYSSGMRMRLAFAVATNIDPDILLIDEILSVGDLTFQSKCLERINQYKHKGCTMLLVSHDMGQIEKFCDSVLWLKNGKVKGYGSPNEITMAYAEEASNETRRRTPTNLSIDNGSQHHHLKLNENRFGSMEVEISAVRIMDNFENQIKEINSGEPLRIEIDYMSNISAEAPVFGVKISKKDGQMIGEMMLDKHRFNLEDSRRQGTMILDIDRLDLTNGEYFLDVGIYEKNWEYAYDYHWHVYPLQVRSDNYVNGILAPPHAWSFSDNFAGLGQSGLKDTSNLKNFAKFSKYYNRE
jgi:lipopolysaccharide transport system ATP-binding protein